MICTSLLVGIAMITLTNKSILIMKIHLQRPQEDKTCSGVIKNLSMTLSTLISKQM